LNGKNLFWFRSL